MRKWLLVLTIGVVVITAYSMGLGDFLTLNSVKTNMAHLLELQSKSPYGVMAVFFLIYVMATALSFPGATVLTLVAGSLFGLGVGSLLVSFASTLGATAAFLVARYLLRDVVQIKFAKTMTPINHGVQKEGAFYLFSLRLIPVFPFFLINLAMGLTRIPATTFYWVSQIGMLPGTIAYVNAGAELAKIDSLRGILSFDLLIAFALLGLVPLFTKKLVKGMKRKRVYGPFMKQKPKYFDYDMVVIGAGSAGLVTAYISAAVKAKVALIE